jgi:ATP-dependent DNA ligase
VLCAFDLLELDGADLRRLPIENGKRRLAKLLKGASSNIALNEVFDGDGRIIYRHSARAVAKALCPSGSGRHTASGRSRHWLKVKNPAAPAVTREAEEDWH